MLVGSFVIICACVGYYTKVTEFKLLVQCMKRREPLPSKLFQNAWSAHRKLLVREVLNFVDSMFKSSLDGTADAETAKKDWGYLCGAILCLKAKEEKQSIWSDEGETLASYLSYGIFPQLIELKCGEMSEEVNCDLTSFEEICVETFGFPLQSDEMGVYHNKIRAVARTVYMDITNGSMPPMISDFAAEETGIQMFPTGPSSMESLESSLDSYKLYSALDRVRFSLIDEASDGGNVLGTVLVTYFEFLRTCVQVSYLGLNESLLGTVTAIKQDVGSIKCSAVSKNEMQQPILQDHQPHIQNLQQLVYCSEDDQAYIQDRLKMRLDELVFPELLRSLSLLVFQDFDDLVRSVAKRAGLSKDAVSVARVKGVDRMRVKRGQYEEDPSLDKYPPSSYITDTLRCSFICPQSPPQSMSMAWDEVNKEPRLTVLRLKNKAVDGAFPYNLHVNASFQPQCCPHKIITEIQIQHEHVYAMKETNHRMYEVIRAPNAEKI